jgi:hypothetical protein
MRAILLTIPLALLWLGLNNIAVADTTTTTTVAPAAPPPPPIKTMGNGATIVGQAPSNQPTPRLCDELLADCQAAGYKSRGKQGVNNLYFDCMNLLMADVPVMPANLPSSQDLLAHLAECRSIKAPATASAVPTAAAAPAAATTTTTTTTATTPAAVVAPTKNPDPGD